MSSHLGTKDNLLLLLDDLELISKELIENTIAPKEQKISPEDHAALVDLLVSKEEEFRKMLELAKEQAHIEEEINKLKASVAFYELEIQKLQKLLKDAEVLLINAISDARVKLKSIALANRRPASPEQLIEYGAHISSANAVKAPPTWHDGDVRRPYPTGIDAQNGFLNAGNSDKNRDNVTQQNSIPEAQQNLVEVPNAIQIQFDWNHLGELVMSMDGTASSSVSLETSAPIETSLDDIKMNATDSSSSSSSDSQ